MKVYISKYRSHWFSPYTLFEKIFFWKDWAKEDGPNYPEWVEKTSDKLEPISKGVQWVLDKIHPRVEYVKVDRWDMEHGFNSGTDHSSHDQTIA